MQPIANEPLWENVELLLIRGYQCHPFVMVKSVFYGKRKQFTPEITADCHCGSRSNISNIAQHSEVIKVNLFLPEELRNIPDSNYIQFSAVAIYSISVAAKYCNIRMQAEVPKHNFRFIGHPDIVLVTQKDNFICT